MHGRGFGHMIAIMSDPIIALFAEGRSVALGAGQTLFRAEEPVRDVFMVQSGRVQLLRHTVEGARLVLQDAGARAVLAEASAYAQSYHCDAIAATTARLAALPRERFIAGMAADHTAAAAWAGTLARSVQSARFRAEIRALPKLADRLDAWLTETGAMPERGRWQDVAAELGVTREALYRELTRRRRAGNGDLLSARADESRGTTCSTSRKAYDA